MFLLRDWSPGSDPHDCHDRSVLRCKDDMQNETHRTQIRLILSSTMICLLIILYRRGHTPPIPPLTLCCSSTQHIWTLHCSASWSYKPSMSADAAAPQTAIAASWILQRQVHDTKKIHVGVIKWMVQASGWRLTWSKRGHSKEFTMALTGRKMYRHY